MDREQKRIVEKLNIIDDTFFHKLTEDRGVCEEMLRTFLENDEIRVVSNRPQMYLRNTGARSVILDVLCKDAAGEYFNVEVQKSDNDNHQKRVRYHGSNIDTYVTEKGIAYDEIPDVYVIYISKFDMFQMNSSIYHIDRTVRETGEVVDNGFHEIYLNTNGKDEGKIGELLRYMADTTGESPQFPTISNRVRYFKKEKEGVEIMCDIVEKYAQERADIAAKETARETAKTSARKLFEKGVSYEIVKESVELEEEELNQIYEDVMGILCP